MKNKHYYVVTGNRTKLYYLTDTGKKKFELLHPNFSNLHCSDEEHCEALEWLEANAKLVGYAEAFAY